MRPKRRFQNPSIKDAPPRHEPRPCTGRGSLSAYPYDRPLRSALVMTTGMASADTALVAWVSPASADATVSVAAVIGALTMPGGACGGLGLVEAVKGDLALLVHLNDPDLDLVTDAQDVLDLVYATLGHTGYVEQAVLAGQLAGDVWRYGLYRLVIVRQPGAARGQDDRGLFREGGGNGGGDFGIGDDARVGAVKAPAAQELHRYGTGAIFVDARGGASRGDDDDGGALWAHSG